MGNFIQDFLNRKLEEKKMIDNKNNDVFINKPEDNIGKSFEEQDDISNFLEDSGNNKSSENNEISNNSNIQNNKKDKNATKIVIKKVSYVKAWIWIIIQFVVGFYLLYVSNAYLQTHNPEKRFFTSSISYIKTKFSSMLFNMGGIFSEFVGNHYKERRKNLVLEISNLEEKLKKCKFNKDNKKDREWKKDIENKLKSLKNYVLNKNISLKEFINDYQKIELWFYSYKGEIEKYCNKK